MNVAVQGHSGVSYGVGNLEQTISKIVAIDVACSMSCHSELLRYSLNISSPCAIGSE